MTVKNFRHCVQKLHNIYLWNALGSSGRLLSQLWVHLHIRILIVLWGNCVRQNNTFKNGGIWPEVRRSTHHPPQRPIYSSVPTAALLAWRGAPSIIMTSVCGWEDGEGSCPCSFTSDSYWLVRVPVQRGGVGGERSSKKIFEHKKFLAFGKGCEMKLKALKASNWTWALIILLHIHPFLH